MLRAETLKLTTVPATKIAVLIAALGLLATQLVSTVLMPYLVNSEGTDPEVAGELPVIDMTLASEQLAVLNLLGGSGSIGVVLIAVILLGVLAGISDFRFGGMVGTALAQPRRERIVLAKTGATALIGAATGLILAALSVTALLLALVLDGTALAATLPEVLGTLGRGVLAITFLSLIGLAFGLLLRNQLTAVLVTLAVLVLEPILLGIIQLATGTLPIWAQLMPNTLAHALITAPNALTGAAATAALTALTALLLTGAALTLKRRSL
ncbi:hypothetical protein I6N91_16255 [Arthrobacter sp. MSA 4-2]|uniref:hypothetical protein n=1 Tax=Arthrobacter sp. MSA 4-2 TaxID=2794349 RepID=UPI0018E8A3DC|nr:hypothetical protein [Arthrobacter sp. MSA 4-2]MBJ2122533.1 hypothetical protein [Arthrobacter sp. MSA 4-2]